MVCLLIATSGATAQEIRTKRQETKGKAEIQKFLAKATYAQQKAQKKATPVNLVIGFNVDFWAGDDWYPSSVNDLMYDSEKLLSIITKTENGVDWIVSERKTNSYTDGLLSLELYEEYDFDLEALLPDYRIGYSYKSGTSPAIVEIITYQIWTGNTWLIESKDEYQVSNNMITGGTFYEWDGSGLMPESKFTVTTEGSNTIITYQEWSGTSWQNSARDIYSGISMQDLYNEAFSQNVFLEISFFLINDIYYDYTYQEWNGSTWEDYDRQVTENTYAGGSQALQTKIIKTDYWYDDEWHTEDLLRFHYNGKANPDSADLAYFNYLVENEWAYFMKDTYTYDSNGLFDETIIQYNWSGDSLENYLRYSFTWMEINTSVEQPGTEVQRFALKPAYPNPFNPSTNISYTMPNAGYVKIAVYDMLGRMITILDEGLKPAGVYNTRFDAVGISSGQYIVRMETNGFIKSQLVTLIK